MASELARKVIWKLSEAADRVTMRLRSGDPNADFKGPYAAYVKRLQRVLPHEDAMQAAVGGRFDETGRIEAALLRHYGLAADGYLIDVGCGSGRLAQPISAWLRGRYLGIDILRDLVAHARRAVARPDWRFEVVDGIAIPEEDGAADMVCFFSVLTHLLHEQSYGYLEEARRVLRPGGRIVFSFLEFGEPAHWEVFMTTLQGRRRREVFPLNVFIGRDFLPVWAERLGLRLVEVRGGSDAVVAEGALGQSVCVMEKPAAPR